MTKAELLSALAAVAQTDKKTGDIGKSSVSGTRAAVRGVLRTADIRTVSESSAAVYLGKLVSMIVEILRCLAVSDASINVAALSPGTGDGSR